MKARYWTTWERYLPSVGVQTGKTTAGLCLKPWDQALPEEGIEERMSIREPFWRAWERYLPAKDYAEAHLRWAAGAERRERARI